MLHTDIERRRCHKHMILHNRHSTQVTLTGTHFVNVVFMFLPDRWTFVKSERQYVQLHRLNECIVVKCG